MNEIAKCELCGEPMPQGEEMFKFHGYSGPCPKPPMVKQNWMTKLEIQQEEIETLRQQLAEACGLLGGSSEWIRFGSTQERYLYAKIQKFILDNQ